MVSFLSLHRVRLFCFLVWRKKVKTDRSTLTTQEAADYLGLCARTLQKYRQQGIGPRYVKFGNNPRACVRYPKSELERFIDENTVASTSQQMTN